MRKGTPRRSPSAFALFCFLGAALLFCFGVSRKLSAQPSAPQPPRAKAPLATPAPAPAASASAEPPKADAGKDDDKKSKKKDDKDDERKKPEGYEEPLSYAVLEPGKTGGVPIHTEGRFKSPMAHPRFGGPAIVKVGVLLSHVRRYDIKEGAFEADLFVSFTSDKPMPALDPDFTNGKADQKELLVDELTFKLFHFVGTFASPADIHAYPFDTQELTIEIEDDRNGTDQIRLVADKEHTNLDVGFQVSGWDVAYLKARTLDHYFPDRFANDDLYHSRYKLTLGVRRFGTSAAFTVFVPALVIVLISLAGLWFPRDELEVRSNASAPMLAAAVLFHFTLTQALPPTSYLTRADKLMLAVYTSLLLNIFVTWLWFVVDEKHTDRIFRLGKWLVPPVTAAAMAAGTML